MGFEAVNVYDAVGNVVKAVDENGQATLFQYDVLNQLIQTTDAAGNTTRLGYDAVGNLVSQTDGNGHTSTVRYNADNWPTVTTDPNGHTSSVAYDPDGNVIKATDANGQSTLFRFDVRNQPVATTDPNHHTSTASYNALGEQIATADGNAHSTQFQYDAAGELLGVLDPNLALVAYQYTAAGELASETDPVGNKTVYGYDLCGNLSSVTQPTGGVSQLLYDNNNQLIQSIDADGRKKVFSYDQDGRLTGELWYDAGGTLVDQRQYTYDKAGNLLTASNNFGTYTFTYDNANKLLTQTDPFGLKLTYGYDEAGNVTSVQDSLGGVVSSTYDPANQLLSRTLSGTGVIPLRLDFTYTPDGQVATITRYKDLAGTQKVGTSIYSYDPAGNLLEVKHQNANGSTLGDYSYAYDAADQLLTEWNNGTATNYRYDPAGQLVGVGSSSFTYDPNGNRTLPGYQTGTGNELLSDGTWNYSYDAAGNVVTKTNIATGDVWTYGYDLNNNLTSATEKDKNGNVLQSVTLQYDAFGQLVEEDTTTGGQTTVQRYACDAEGNVWADLDGNNNLVARRLYADIDGQMQAIARETIAGGSATAAAWYLNDHLGSVRDIQDNATGAVLDHLDYDAYGNLTNETQPGNGDRFKYAQGTWDATLGLYHFGARWYDPASGRWEEQDPLGLGPDSNDYRYVGNGPTDGIDPAGTDPGFSWYDFVPGVNLAVEGGKYAVNWFEARRLNAKTINKVNQEHARDDPAEQAMRFRTGGEAGSSYINSVSGTYDPSIKLRHHEAVQIAKPFVRGYVEFAASAGMFVGGSRFALRYNKWFNETAKREATQEEIGALEASVPAGIDVKNVAKLIQDSNPRMPLTEVNAQSALKMPRGATRAEASGPGIGGGDVRFYGADDSLILRREVKCINGSFSAFNKRLSYAADQLGGAGEVYMQVPQGTDVSALLAKFRGVRGRKMSDYAGVRLHAMDPSGHVIYSGPVK